MKWWAHKNLMRREVELLAIDERGDRRSYGLPVTITMRSEDPSDVGGLVEPTLSVPIPAAQALLQALWDIGLRPDTGEGGSAEVAALKGHIKFAEHVSTTLLERIAADAAKR